MPLTHRIAPFVHPALVEAIETVAGAAQRGYRRLPRQWRQQVEALLDWAVESGALHAAVVVLLTVILLDVLLHVANSRPEASANSPSSRPRQRQIKLRAASSLGQWADIFRLAGHTGLVLHVGSACAAQPATRRPARRAGGADPPAAQGRQSRRRRRGHGARRGNLESFVHVETWPEPSSGACCVVCAFDTFSEQCQLSTRAAKKAEGRSDEDQYPPSKQPAACRPPLARLFPVHS